MQMQDEMNATSMHFRGRKYLAEYDEHAGGGEVEMEIEMDVEMLEVQQMPAKGQPLLPMGLFFIKNFEQFLFEFVAGTLSGSGKPPISMESFLEGLQTRLTDKQEVQSSRQADLERTQGQLTENTELIHKVNFLPFLQYFFNFKLEQGMPQLEQKFKMFQDVRLYMRDLLDCLNEKYQQIVALDEKVMIMWKQRTEFLVGRRRQDVQVQLLE